MSFVVIRRFRSGGEPASSRAFGDETEARAVARRWAEEGWEVSLISPRRGMQRTVRVDHPAEMPPRHVDDDGARKEASR